MSIPRPGADAALPGIAALHAAGALAGLDTTGAVLLHQRSNAVFRLPRTAMVARLAPDTPLRRARANAAIAVTRWLAEQPGPVAVAPAELPQPVIVPASPTFPGSEASVAGADGGGGAVVTFWPQHPVSPVSPTDLGRLVRRLHTLPPPPVRLPRWRPLHRLGEALDLDRGRPQPVLTEQAHRWLTDRADALIAAATTTVFPLGEGLVHADAQTSNVVRTRDETGFLLIDFDQVCWGPRELDLLTGLPDHFHLPARDRAAFLDAYRYDLAKHDGWVVLRDIAELHSLSAYLRRATSSPEAAQELHLRLESLRAEDRGVLWHALS